MLSPRVITTQVPAHCGKTIRLQGWLHHLRKLGKVNFLLLRDRAGIVQAVLSDTDAAPLLEPKAFAESVLELVGTVVEAEQAPGGYELHNVTVMVLNATDEPPPIILNKQELNVQLPYFLNHAAIGWRHPQKQAMLRLNAGVMAGFRNALTIKGFTEIQTPKLVGSATESGANVYAVSHFDQTAYLAQSPQLYKQMMVGVLERVFEVAPVFRAEPHFSSRHINEYVSMDVEFGFINNHFDVMMLLESLIRDMLAYLETHHADELSQLAIEMPRLPADKFPWIQFHDAQALLHEQFGIQDVLGEPDLSPEHERILGKWAREVYQSDYLFVVGYPMAKRPFYTHPDPTNPQFSNSFDLLFRGMELVTGGQRLHQYADYLSAAAERDYDTIPFEAYFEAFKYGMPPHGGFAIGLERFMMQLLRLGNIRWVTLFPRDPNRLLP